jgi:hypothetical protein
MLPGASGRAGLVHWHHMLPQLKWTAAQMQWLSLFFALREPKYTEPPSQNLTIRRATILIPHLCAPTLFYVRNVRFGLCHGHWVCAVPRMKGMQQSFSLSRTHFLALMTGSKRSVSLGPIKRLPQTRVIPRRETRGQAGARLLNLCEPTTRSTPFATGPTLPLSRLLEHRARVTCEQSWPDRAESIYLGHE